LKGLKNEKFNHSIRKNKSSLKHPYAAIEHRVIDSPAFADLSHSSVRLMLIVVRQLTLTNNGQLQATWSYCKPSGFGSENTLRAAIAELISHGFIYRTRSRGPN
jgi:DNA-binding GntR family transcriptional regulator